MLNLTGTVKRKTKDNHGNVIKLTPVERVWIASSKRILKWALKNEEVIPHFYHELIQLITWRYGFEVLEDVYDDYLETIRR